MPRTLITGASGFIGKNLVHACIESGREVIALFRSEASARSLAVYGEKSVQCDIADIRNTDAIAMRLGEVDEVFHMAGIVCPNSQADADLVNVEATAKLADAASRVNNPPRFVYVSSLAASGPCEEQDGRIIPRRESDFGRPVSIYGRSKLLAENSLRKYSDRLPISIVRPPGVFGAHDRNLLEMFRMVRHGWNMVGVSKRFQYSFVHATDLASGLIKVVERGERLENDGCSSNGIYFLADPQPMTMVALGDRIAETMGIRHPRHVASPAVVVRTLAILSEWYGFLSGKKVFLNRDKAREAVSGSWVCDVEKAKIKLGFEVGKSIPERLEETFEWYVAQNYIPSSR